MYTKLFASRKHVSLLNDPENATLHDLIFKFLFRRDVSQSSLLDHNIPDEQENKYIHRGIIFLSLLIQICLKHIAVPLKKFGSKVEHFLNRNVASNENPDGCYRLSLVGHLDRRIELDKDIRQGDGRYYPALTIMASKIAYEDKSVIETVVSRHWKMEFLQFYDFYNEFQKKWTTQAFMFKEQNADNDTIIVAFRGTSPFEADDWSTDFDLSWCKIDGMGKVHTGFMFALGLKKYHHEAGDELGDYCGYWPKEIEHDHKYPLAYYTLRKKLKEIMKHNETAKFIVTGHSLGGALAVLFPAILALHGEVEILDRLHGIYTYGQPRVGDGKFSQFMKKNLREHNIKYYRIVYGYDIVPTVPWDNTLMTFEHFGTCIHFNSLYYGKILPEEKPLKKNEKEGYVKKCWWLLRCILMCIIWFIFKRLNALWELIRGLIIGFVLGPEYKEGWLLIVARMLGILCPGVINHCPQDYVNATRLASEDLFLNYDAVTFK